MTKHDFYFDKSFHAKFDLRDESYLEEFAHWLTQNRVPSEQEDVTNIAEELLFVVKTLLQEYEHKVHDLIRAKELTQAKLALLMSDNLNERKHAGFDDYYTQFNELVAAMLLGNTSIEVQTIGPYACMHRNLTTGQLEFDRSRMPNDEKIGLMLASVFKKMARVSRSTMRTVSLLDDFNNSQENNTHEFTESERYQYVGFVAQIFMEMEIITVDERPGIDYLILLESEQEDKYPELIKSLAMSLRGEVKETETLGKKSLSFFPDQNMLDLLRLSKGRKQELRKFGVLLAVNGRPTCQALEAATFLEGRSKETLHFIMLSEQFSAQQDKVFVLLQALGLSEVTKYHNVYFDPKLHPEVTAYVLLNTLHKEIRKVYGKLQM